MPYADERAPPEPELAPCVEKDRSKASAKAAATNHLLSTMFARLSYEMGRLRR